MICVSLFRTGQARVHPSVAPWRPHDNLTITALPFYRGPRASVRQNVLYLVLSAKRFCERTGPSATKSFFTVRISFKKSHDRCIWPQCTCSTLCDEITWTSFLALGDIPQLGENVNSPRNLASTCVYATCKSEGTPKCNMSSNKALICKSAVLQLLRAAATRVPHSRNAPDTTHIRALRDNTCIFLHDNTCLNSAHVEQRLRSAGGRPRPTWANNTTLPARIRRERSGITVVTTAMC